MRSSPSRYAIVVDGTTALAPEVERELDIRWLPLHVNLGLDSFTVGVDLTNEDFYRRIAAPGVRPQTSQPSLGECRDVYDAAVGEGAREILVLTIARELSGTHSVASTAGALVPGTRVEVVDTRTAAASIGLIAAACARTRRQGGTFSQAVDVARALAGNVGIIALLDTIEYLKRGGRASKAQALFGSLLAVKPIIEVREGDVHAVDRVRTRDRAFSRLKELIQARIPAGARIHAATQYTHDPARARLLGEWLQSRFHCVEHWTAEGGPVLATHTGPGAVGLSWYEERSAA
ncbi:MAG: DegV family protein [Candidatus Limnocylindria bacterium]